jgi:hypothetical protein
MRNRKVSTPKGDFDESVELMLEIADLEQHGFGDSQEVRKLEDEAERHWNSLNEAEQLLVRALSADLWFLTDAELGGRAPRDGESESLAAARYVENWQKVASLLHESPALATGIDGVALRAELWSALEQPAVARRFYDRLEQQRPGARLTIAAQRIARRRAALSISPNPHKCPFPLLHGSQRAA